MEELLLQPGSMGGLWTKVREVDGVGQQLHQADGRKRKEQGAAPGRLYSGPRYS